ncbi:MAG TPA: YdeI/OmpD-associated family protein [Thermoanaerobaculia bacterium]|nr:YdeI/OmpD-associated family protein [Thermoanaerobaculia bacterium]
MSKPKLLHVSTREEWRAWLEEHHATETEVWLVFAKKHSGKPRVSYDAAVEEALCFGWIDSIARTLDDDHSAQKFTPRKDRTNWSSSNLERVERLMAEGKMTKAGIAKMHPDPDYRPPERIGAEPPPWLEEALRKEPAAWESFQRLAPSHRKNYVRWITEAKKEETRQRRLQEAIRMLERNEKLGITPPPTR